MLPGACSQFCLRKANVIWTFFFFPLLLTLEGFARGSSCWVHSGKQNRERNAQNQKYQGQETEKWLKFEPSEAGTASPPAAAEGTPRVGSPARPEALALPAAPSVPLEGSGRDPQPPEGPNRPGSRTSCRSRRHRRLQLPPAPLPSPLCQQTGGLRAGLGGSVLPTASRACCTTASPVPTLRLLPEREKKAAIPVSRLLKKKKSLF